MLYCYIAKPNYQGSFYVDIARYVKVWLAHTSSVRIIQFSKALLVTNKGVAGYLETWRCLRKFIRVGTNVRRRPYYENKHITSVRRCCYRLPVNL